MKDILNNDRCLCTKTFITQSHYEIQILIIQFMMQLYNDIYSIYMHIYIHTYIYICVKETFITAKIDILDTKQ